MLALLFALEATGEATTLRSGASPKKGLIAFVGTATGVPQLYTVKADGTQSRQLTFEGGGIGPVYNSVFANSGPIWSADGKRIVVGIAQGVLATMRPDGSDRVDITGTAPVFSPDGNWLAYEVCQSSACNLYVAHANGRNPLLIDTGVQRPSYPGEPAWSADSKLLTYVKSAKQLWLADRRGSNTTEVPAGGHLVFTPVFFPDDNTITFTGEGIPASVFSVSIGAASPTKQVPSIGESGYLVQSPTRTQLVAAGNTMGPGGLLSILDETFTRTRIGSANAFQPVWSPNGAVVAFAYCDRTFTGFPGGPCSIRVGDGTTTTTVYNGPAVESRDWQQGFDWSPDSSSLVLSVASGGGPYRLKIVGADGTGLAPLTPSGTDNQTFPAWQPATH